MYNAIKKTIALSDGQTIEIETGKLAKQADGAVVVKQGDTMLLATVVSAKEVKDDVDFMPLSVDYREKYAANGRFPGGFLKREARPSDYEILVARLVDRALRPLFPSDFHAETFVSVMLMSADPDIQPDALAGLAASAALAVSDIPFEGPISECRVARINGEFVVNPTFSAMKENPCDLDIIVAATMDNIMMVEGEMNEVSESVVLEAITCAHEAIKIQCKAQIELMQEVGKTEKYAYCHEVNDEELRQAVIAATYDKAYAVAKSMLPKHERAEQFDAVVNQYIESIPEEERDEKTPLIKRYYHDNVLKRAMRAMILDEGIRLDGRKTTEIRPIWCETDYLPAPHGSSVFTRGETQSITTVTLGTKMDEKIIDDVLREGTDKFVLHYNFPPFSTGEARPQRATSRREIGHGNLALRALKPMLPPTTECPYAIRVVSDILESNGSSSMATVCAGSLALMDAGVKMKKPVSGIAMGLIAEDSKYAILSDILGDEDHLGDMDFKVTGTVDGITAVQMDIKVDGLPYEILEQALEQARQGRMHILGIMNQVMPAPREDYKPHVPRMVQIIIPKEFIGAVIGPGGKIIQDLQEKTDTVITITEENNTGIVDIFSANKEGIEKALERIKGIIAVPEVGEVYNGTIKSITTFGAFVEILPGKEGLLHISEIDHRRFNDMEETGLKEGDPIEVKLIEVDEKSNRLRLSRKALIPNETGYVPENDGERRNNGGQRGGQRNSGGHRGDRREGRGGQRSGGYRGDRNDREDRGDRRERAPRNDHDNDNNE